MMRPAVVLTPAPRSQTGIPSSGRCPPCLPPRGARRRSCTEGPGRGPCPASPLHTHRSLPQLPLRFSPSFAPRRPLPTPGVPPPSLAEQQQREGHGSAAARPLGATAARHARPETRFSWGGPCWGHSRQRGPRCQPGTAAPCLTFPPAHGHSPSRSGRPDEEPKAPCRTASLPRPALLPGRRRACPSQRPGRAIG